MKKRKVELYEILASSSDVAASDELEDKVYSEPKAYKAFARARSGREIIFTLDGAFIIFVVIMLMIGTAFFLGYQKGAGETKASFMRNTNNLSRVEAVDKIQLVTEYTPPTGSIEIPNGKYSLKLISLKRNNENYRRLVDLKRQVLGNSLVASSKLHLFIFDSGKGGVYSLAIGLFDELDDEMLATMQGFFKNYSLDGKNPAFKSFSSERVEDLGEARVEN